MAFHTALALQQGVSSEETGAIRERRLPVDRRFAALSTLAKTLIEKRGQSTAGKSLPAARLAGLNAENENRRIRRLYGFVQSRFGLEEIVMGTQSTPANSSTR